MKKTMLVTIMGMLLLPLAAAQTDTVQWGYEKYHYSLWYDTLPEFYTYYLHEDWPGLKLWKWDCDRHNEMMAMPQHVEGPTPVFGVSVTEPMVYGSIASITRYDWYLPEYVYLFQKVGDTLELRDSARWDTVPPKVMKIALNADTDRFGFELVKVYETMFKDPVLVDSVFYTATSRNGDFAHCGSSYYATEYYPVITMHVSHRNGSRDNTWCPTPTWWEPLFWNTRLRKFYCQDDSVGEYLHYFTPFTSPVFGMFFPIVDYVELIVTSSDTAMGTAGPVAHVARNTSQPIWARAKRGYRFSHWQEDWSPYATRSVYIVNDTTRYTAVFEALERYRVEGMSDDEAAGYVRVDDSVYYEGDTAVLEAVATSGMKFRYWSNGSTENPLRIVVESDTVVTAHFTALERYDVEALSNNDEKGYVLGGGSYQEDDTARLEAVPTSSRYVFSSWSTGDTVNPLLVVVESDTVVTAYFAGSGVGMVAPEGDGATFALTPNPAHGKVTVTLGEAAKEGTVLRVQDAAGREVLRKELAPQTRTTVIGVAELPAGTYFVTLATAEGSGTRKLVVE